MRQGLLAGKLLRTAQAGRALGQLEPLTGPCSAVFVSVVDALVSVSNVLVSALFTFVFAVFVLVLVFDVFVFVVFAVTGV